MISNVSKYGLTLSRMSISPSGLININACDDASSFIVDLEEDITMPIGDNLARVMVLGAGGGDYSTRPNYKASTVWVALRTPERYSEKVT